MAEPITAEFGQTVPETQSSCFSVSMLLFFVVFSATKSSSPESEAWNVLQTYIFRFKCASAEFTFAAAKREAAFFFFFFSSNNINFAGKWNFHLQIQTFILQQQLSLLLLLQNGRQLFFFFLCLFQRQNQLCRKVTLGVCCKLTFSDSNVHFTATAEFTFASVKR